MLSARTLFAVLLACVSVIACSDGAVPSVSLPVDAGALSAEDARRNGSVDGSPMSLDAQVDAGPIRDGAFFEASTDDGILGTLSGACGEVRAELTTAVPSYKVDALTFVTGEIYDKASLSPGGDRLFDTPNAGGSSTESEVMSFEVLRLCEGATLLKTETEIAYAAPVAGQPNSITDILVEIDGKKVGVSVTRAYKPVSQGPQTDAEIKTLLEKKLDGINVSSMRVLPADKWVKQILHVLAVNQASVDTITRVLPTIGAAKRADTIVLVTKTTGGGFIYCNPDPALGAECP
jgi:hypothetical protein